MNTGTIHNIVKAKALANYKLQVTFDDGLQKTIDVLPFIKEGVSSSLKDAEYFKNVIVENGYITWQNGFDFCPVFLRNL